jgi:hypothetical protein
MGFKNYQKKIAFFAAALGLSSCGHGGSSYSLLADSQNFNQNVATINNKVDILWVVDNSSSMTPLQNNLVSNFGSFIKNFQAKGYDFRIAVTSSDAYLANKAFNNNPAYSKFKDGGGSAHTGIFVIDPSTPNITSTFVTNASIGQNGSGDERVFSSFKEALLDPQNAGFLRPDSFLSVIILSDEDDFSDPTRREGSWLYQGGVADHSYTNPNLETVDSYVSFLDQLTQTTDVNRRYNVSAITVLDNTCLKSHAPMAPSTIIGQRYIDLANKTNGVLGSICDSSYANALQAIQQRILELSTQFPLGRQPVESTIKVVVAGVSVANDATNGWTYVTSSNSIMFHGSAVPAQGASIQVNFDPVGVKN